MTAPTLGSPVQLQLEGFPPGVHQIDAETYHAQKDVLSSSGARLLIKPNCPAKFRQAMDYPQPAKKTFDMGTAAHREVLGDGPDLVVVDAKLWNTDVIKAEVKAIRAAGAVPLKRGEYDTVQAMAKALRQHPLARKLFDPERGRPEQSLFWRDADSGVDCRARLDWLPHTDGGRMLLADYKTAASASERAFQRAVQDYHYEQQDEWYRTGVTACGVASDPVLMFVVQEKDPPYLVNVLQVSQLWQLMAEDRNKKARATFAACMASGEWPGYPIEVQTVEPPGWLETEHQREYA